MDKLKLIISLTIIVIASYAGTFFSGVTLSGVSNLCVPLGGLTYYNMFVDENIDAENSLGSGTVSVSVTRSVSNPATYIDADGVVHITTTSNTPRWDYGYYDSTGFHAWPDGKARLRQEGAGTNYLTYTTFSAGTTVSTGWTNNDDVTGSPTYSLVAETLTGISGSQAQRIVYSSAADPGSYIQFLQSTAVGTFSQNDYVTVSFWAKGTIANAIMQLSFIEKDSSSVSGTSHNSSDIVSNLSATEWRRFTYTAQATDADVSLILARVLFASISSNVNIDVQISCFQLEKSMYPSSFIPTTTAALTRNAETITPPATDNFPAPYGNNCLSFDGQNASGDDYVSVPNSATGNQIYGSTAYSVEGWVFVRSDGEGDYGRIFDCNGASYINARDQSGSNINIGFGIDLDGTDVSRINATTTNAWHHVVMVYDDSTKKITSYVDNVGALSGAGSGNIINDSSFAKYIGNNSATTRTFDGFIRRIRIFRNKALSSDDVATLYASGVYTQNETCPVTGCTAEYNFATGSGSTLVDTVAGNNGTISGATWSKDQHDFTVLLAYEPTMMPDEQASDYKTIFYQSFSGNNYNEISFKYNSNAANKVYAEVYSNGNSKSASPSNGYCSTWNRYDPHVLVLTGSTTANGDGKKLCLYDNGVLIGSNVDYAIPAGTLNSIFSLQNSSYQSNTWKAIMFWNRVLSQADVSAVTGAVTNR